MKHNVRVFPFSISVSALAHASPRRWVKAAHRARHSCTEHAALRRRERLLLSFRRCTGAHAATATIQYVRLQSCAAQLDRSGEIARVPLPNSEVAQRLSSFFSGEAESLYAVARVSRRPGVKRPRPDGGESDSTDADQGGMVLAAGRSRSGQTEVLREKAGADLSWKGTKGN
jgi:hypothetical protein